MADIQLGSGSSSASSHRATQSSHTLNRRYVERPSNLFIEEAARTADDTTSSPVSTPSRLVNLRVHAAELQKLQAEAATPNIEETSLDTHISQVVPRVVEFGTDPQNNPTELNLSQVVPPEDQVEQPVSVMEMSLLPAVQPTANYTSQQIDAPEMSIVSQSATQQPAEIDTQALAMNIAADYAAASFGASVNDNDASYTLGAGAVATSDASIDVIAQAASEAIAAIRVATDPAEVAEQVASLKAFASNIKATSSAPEMLELSDTIEKFVDVAMKSTQVQAEVNKREAKKSDPVKVATKTAKRATAPKITRTAAPKVSARPVASRTARPGLAKARPASRRTARSASALVADEDQALRNALRSVAAIDDEPSISEKPLRRKTKRSKAGHKRFALAFICATACVAAIVYFVGMNIPDISVKVAAMQTGIEASYPSYVPRDFSLSDINSEDGKITLTFKGPEQTSFTLSEEKSSWDSTALLRNYVGPTWQDNYTTTHEQGVTVYISGSNAAWVNGGVLYKITTSSSNSLTNKQLRNIVTSL